MIIGIGYQSLGICAGSGGPEPVRARSNDEPVQMSEAPARFHKLYREGVEQLRLHRSLGAQAEVEH